MKKKTTQIKAASWKAGVSFAVYIVYKLNATIS